jgi:branched-chain amino acid transport system substrate-binding protein
MKALHVKRLFVVDDAQVYGVGVARMTAAAARVNGIRVVGTGRMDYRASNYRRLAREIRHTRADGFFFGGITADNAVQLYADVFRASPKIKFFGPDGVAETAFTKRIPKGAQRRMHITVGTIDPLDYPGQKFFADFDTKFGREPQPYAIYGYEAMSLLLDAMNRAGAACADRAAVVAQVFATRGRESVIGKYSIDKDGDVTTSRFGRFVIRRGFLSYAGTTFVKRDAYGHPLGR